MAAATVLCGARPAKRTSGHGRASEESAAAYADTLGYPDSLLARYYFTEGLKASLIDTDSNSLRRALSFYERTLELDSLHAPAYYAAATLAAGQDLARALDYSRRANAIDSTNLWYATQLGRLMVMSGSYDEATEVFEKLKKLAPGNPENYRMLAALYENDGRPYMAISVLDSAEVRLGRIEELAAMKRQMLIGVKLYDKALKETEALIGDYPYDEENYIALGDLQAITGKDSLALRSYAEARRLNPDNPAALVALNEFYKQRGDHDMFLSTAREIFMHDGVALKTKVRFWNDITRDIDYYRNFYRQLHELISTLATRYPTNFEVMQAYATHLVRSGEAEEALKLYKNMAAAPDADVEIFNDIIEIEAYMERPDSMARYCDMAIARFPDDTELYLRRGGLAAFMFKDYKGAAKAYKQGLKLADSDSLRSVFLGSLGDLYHTANDSRRSYSYYDDALRYDPDNVMVLNNYAYYLSLERRELPKARRMAERVALELEKGNATYLDTYGWILYLQGDYDQAKRIMRQAISLDTRGSSELLVHYGDVLAATGDDFMASVYWRKALENGYDKEAIEARLRGEKAKTEDEKEVEKARGKGSRQRK